MTNLEILNGTEGEGDSHLGELSGMVQSEPAEVVEVDEAQVVESVTSTERSVWFEQHKVVLAALGGATLTLLGAASGAAVRRRNKTANQPAI